MHIWNLALFLPFFSFVFSFSAEYCPGFWREENIKYPEERYIIEKHNFGRVNVDRKNLQFKKSKIFLVLVEIWSWLNV